MYLSPSAPERLSSNEIVTANVGDRRRLLRSLRLNRSPKDAFEKVLPEFLIIEQPVATEVRSLLVAPISLGPSLVGEHS